MKFFWCALILLICQNVLALSGHFKSTLYSEKNKSDDESVVLFNNQLGIKQNFTFENNLTFDGQYFFSLRYLKQKNNVEVFNLKNYTFRRFALNDRITTLDEGEQSSVSLHQNLNRINVNYVDEKNQFIMGRTPISHGMSRVISPLDIWDSFQLLSFDTEDRSGVDTIRFKRLIGEMHQLDIGLVFSDDDKKNLHGFLDLKFDVSGTDLEFNYSRFFKNDMFGFGLQGSFLGVGIWAELARNVMFESDDYTRATIGGEYAFTGFLMGQIEYHYNGAGVSDKNLYFSNFLSNDAFIEGEVIFLGKHYLVPGVSWEIHPLLNLSSNLIINVLDHSSYGMIKVEYSALQNLYLDAGVYHVFGGTNDEFQFYGNSALVAVRSYF